MPPRQVTDDLGNVVGRRVTWPDLVCLQKMAPAARMEDGFVDEGAVAGLRTRNIGTPASSEAVAQRAQGKAGSWELGASAGHVSRTLMTVITLATPY